MFTLVVKAWFLCSLFTALGKDVQLFVIIGTYHSHVTKKTRGYGHDAMRLVHHCRGVQHLHMDNIQRGHPRPVAKS